MKPATSIHREIAEPDPATLEQTAASATGWKQSFEQMITRVGTHFSRSDLRAHTAEYLKGLLSSVERKNSWQIAEAMGRPTPYALQHLLDRAGWDAEAVRDDLCSYVVENLSDPQGVLVLDDTGFVKKGEHSVGVKRQYCGRVGKLENCQVGVFLAYATPRGHTFLDRALYLPREWAADSVRRDKAGVPPSIKFATKPQLGHAMLVRAYQAHVPSAWVVGDETYGNDRPLRRDLEKRRKAHIFAIRCDYKIFYDGVRQTVQDIAAALPARAWHRHSAGAGSKGPRWYHWAYVRLSARRAAKGWEQGLLFRRSLTDRTEVEYHIVFARRHTSLDTLVRVIGRRWTVEESFEGAKGEVGLAHYEVRSWHGWHRHITLALWAHAFLTVQRVEASLAEREKKFRWHGAARSFRTRFPKFAVCSSGCIGTGPETPTTSCDGRGGDDTIRPSRSSPTTSTTTLVHRDLQL